MAIFGCLFGSDGTETEHGGRPDRLLHRCTWRGGGPELPELGLCRKHAPLAFPHVC
jgi:hypothetical protein